MGTFPTGTPVLNLVAQVSNPAQARNPDGSTQTLASDRHGALLTRQLGGKHYSQAMRGNLFVTNTVVAGVTIPVVPTTGTKVGTAGMINPLGSGKVVELVALGLGTATAGGFVAVKNMMLAFQLNQSTNGGACTSITKLTSYGYPIGSPSGAAQAFAYTAATFNSGTAGGSFGVFTPEIYPFGTVLTAAGEMPSWTYFEGEVSFGPDCAFTILNTTSTLAAVNVTYVWAEHNI